MAPPPPGGRSGTSPERYWGSVLSRHVRTTVLILTSVLILAVLVSGSMGVGPPPAAGVASYSFPVAAGLCAGTTVVVTPSVAHPATLVVGYGSIFTGVGSFQLRFNVLSAGQACDRIGNFAALRHVNLTLSARDLTIPFAGPDPWFATLDVQMDRSTWMYSMGWSIPTKAGWHLGTDNASPLGSVDIEWNPAASSHLNATFTETVFLDAWAHAGDTIRFTLDLRFVVDNSACFGHCWSPFFDETFTRTFAFDVLATPS